MESINGKRLAGVIVATVLLTGLLVTKPAHAAFPGSNGRRRRRVGAGRHPRGAFEPDLHLEFVRRALRELELVSGTDRKRELATAAGPGKGES
jgi:hypothetical protein